MAPGPICSDRAAAPKFSYSAFDTYDALPAALRVPVRLPDPAAERPVAAFAFGATAHEAFEAFTKERRERAARVRRAADPRGPGARLFRERWVPAEFGDRTTEESYQRRVATLLDNFWTGEISSLGEAMHEELAFELVIDGAAGAPPVVISRLDRPDRSAARRAASRSSTTRPAAPAPRRA